MERIMLRMSTVVRRQLAHELAGFDLTVAQYMVLMALKRRESATMSELAEATYQVSATMTGIIGRLEDRDLVARNRDPADRRALRVTLNPAGAELLKNVQAQRHKGFLEAFTNLSGEDRRELVRLMGVYLEATEALLEET